MGQGGAELFGHLLPVRFVVGELDMPLRGRLGVKGNGEMSGLLILLNVEQHLGEAIERGGVHAFGRENRAADKCEVRPIHQRHPIQQEKLFHLALMWPLLVSSAMGDMPPLRSLRAPPIT